MLCCTSEMGDGMAGTTGYCSAMNRGLAGYLLTSSKSSSTNSSPVMPVRLSRARSPRSMRPCSSAGLVRSIMTPALSVSTLRLISQMVWTSAFLVVAS